MSTYETGSILLKSGIISGKDLTDEAALTKLYVLCSKGYSNSKIKKLMQENIRGELTEEG
jgi:L-asparaginase